MGGLPCLSLPRGEAMTDQRQQSVCVGCKFVSDVGERHASCLWGMSAKLPTWMTPTRATSMVLLVGPHRIQSCPVREDADTTETHL